MSTRAQEGPETKEFRRWFEEQVSDNGLVDINFFPGDGLTKDTTLEDFFAENNRLNRLIAAGAVVNRRDVF